MFKLGLLFSELSHSLSISYDVDNLSTQTNDHTVTRYSFSKLSYIHNSKWFIDNPTLPGEAIRIELADIFEARASIDQHFSNGRAIVPLSRD